MPSYRSKNTAPIIHKEATVSPSVLFLEESNSFGTYPIPSRRTRVNTRANLRHHCIIEPGASIGRGAQLDCGVYVAVGAKIGHSTHVQEMTHVGPYTQVNQRTFIGSKSNICAYAQVGAHAILQEGVVLRRNHKSGAPMLEDHVFVGAGAALVGPIAIGNHAYIMPGAVISRHIPTEHIGYADNQCMSVDDSRVDTHFPDLINALAQPEGRHTLKHATLNTGW